MSSINGIDIVKEATVPTTLGVQTVRTPTFDLFCQIMELVEKNNLSLPPELLTLDWLGVHEESVEKALEFKRKNEDQRNAAITRWILTTRNLVPIVVVSVTDLNATQVAKLSIGDIAVIVGRALSLINIEQTMEIIESFFPEAGGLSGIVKSIRKVFDPPQTEDGESSDGTTGPSK